MGFWRPGFGLDFDMLYRRHDRNRLVPPFLTREHSKVRLNNSMFVPRGMICQATWMILAKRNEQNTPKFYLTINGRSLCLSICPSIISTTVHPTDFTLGGRISEYCSTECEVVWMSISRKAARSNTRGITYYIRGPK